MEVLLTVKNITDRGLKICGAIQEKLSRSQMKTLKNDILPHIS